MHLDLESQENYFGGVHCTKIDSGNKPKTDTIDDADENITEGRHKSVIYVGNSTLKTTDNTTQSANKCSSKIVSKEVLDDRMSLVSTENSKIVTVVFHETFSYATQIVNELTSACDNYRSDAEDDFPLGMEAEYLTRIPYSVESEWY